MPDFMEAKLENQIPFNNNHPDRQSSDGASDVLITTWDLTLKTWYYLYVILD